MAMGVAEFPSETLKPLHMPIGSSRNRPGKAFQKAARKTEASTASERELSFNSPEQSRTSLTDHETRARPRGPSNLSDRSFSTSNTKSSLTCDVLQGTSSFKQNNSSRSELRNQNESDYRKDHDLLRQTGVHMSKGLGRIAKATVQAPMEISVGLTKGFHNFPKMWGDDTVRPHEQIKDFKSGAMAAGKEFGLGWYDGVSGLVIQPWKGAQKEGPSGFIKGIGKGIGGFVMKPLAGFSGVLSHTMKGVHKEVQKLFGSNIEDYLVASRASQGYEDWLQSSDAEKQDIIDRWTLIKECLKEKHDPDKIMQDILRAHRLRNIEHGAVRHSCENTASSDHASSDQRSINMDLEESLVASVIKENAQLSAHGSLRTNTQENSIVDQVTEDDAFQLQRQQELADYEAYQEDLRQAIVSSEAEARQHESEILEYNAHLKRAMAQSLREEIQKGCQREWAFDMTLSNEAGKELKRTEQECKMAEKGLVVKTDGPSSTQEDILVDQGNFAGTRRTEFEGRQQPQQGEKTRKEKEAEEIVLEYVRKQSLLEQDHQNKGKNRTNISEL